MLIFVIYGEPDQEKPPQTLRFSPDEKPKSCDVPHPKKSSIIFTSDRDFDPPLCGSTHPRAIAAINARNNPKPVRDP
jgi:hypothetical protein